LARNIKHFFRLIQYSSEILNKKYSNPFEIRSFNLKFWQIKKPYRYFLENFNEDNRGLVKLLL